METEKPEPRGIASTIVFAALLIAIPYFAGEALYPKPVSPKKKTLVVVSNASRPSHTLSLPISKSFTIKREGDEIRVSVKNHGPRSLAFSTFPPRWEPMIIDSTGRLLTNPEAFYSKVEMRGEIEKDWKVLQPGESHSFLVWGHNQGGQRGVAGVTGTAQIDYSTQDSKFGRPVVDQRQFGDARILGDERAVCVLP